MEYNKICAFCGNEYQSENIQSAFCSEGCRKEHRKKMKRQYYMCSRKTLQELDKIIEEKIKNSGITNTALNKKFDNLKEKMIAIDNALYQLQKEFEMVKKEISLSANTEKPKPSVEKIETPKTTAKIDARPKQQTENISSNLVMHECKRMKARATTLPCGYRGPCWYPDKCENNPLGNKPENVD